MKKKAIHMKFLNHSIGFCLLLTLLCYSCASDYLDTAPTNQVSPADLFKDEAYAAYAVSGLEKLMKTTYPTNKLDGVSFNGEGSVKLMYAEYQGADMYCPRNNFYTIFNGASHAIPTSSYTEYMWHYYYKVISNANAIINYVDPEGSHKFKYIYAQALTYRAYCYLQLLQFYSPRWCDSQNGSADGVVLRLNTSSTGDCPLSSMLTCYEQIYNDLNQAITYYQASGIARKEDENHKINVNAAYATYARAALTREDWSTAAHYAALARAGYPLMNADEYFDGFSTVNREWIWSIYDSEEESLGNSSLAARLAYNSSSTLVCTYPAIQEGGLCLSFCCCDFQCKISGINGIFKHCIFCNVFIPIKRAVHNSFDALPFVLCCCILDAVHQIRVCCCKRFRRCDSVFRFHGFFLLWFFHIIFWTTRIFRAVKYCYWQCLVGRHIQGHGIDNDFL